MTKDLISNSRYLPYNPELKDRACKMKNNPTLAEKKLWNKFLKNLIKYVKKIKIILKLQKSPL
jgi:very-short-patch-repair endonuclease